MILTECIFVFLIRNRINPIPKTKSAAKILGWGVVPYARKKSWPKTDPSAMFGVCDENLYDPNIGISGELPALN